MSGGSTTTTQNQQSTTQLPPWVNQAAQQNYAFAQNVANRPLMQYQGQQVADVSPQTNQAWQLAATSGNAGQPQYDASTAGYLGILGQGAPQVTAGQLANTDLSPYMNPYTQNVINTSLQALEAQRQQSIMGNNKTAVQSNAFGGSRQGITDAVTNAQSALAAGQLNAGLESQNFTQAQAAATGDINRNLAAATSNQGAILQNNQQDLTAASGLETLGNDATRNVLQQYSMLSDAGSQQQAQAQAQINANMNQFNQAYNYPTTQLNTLLASLGMTPYGQSQTTSGQTTKSSTPDYAQSALGLLSIAGGMFGGPPGAAAGSAVAGALGPSDKRIKKNIKRVGTHSPSGLPTYQFNFKGERPGAPKTTGPIAQDVEKKFPQAVVHNQAGIKHVIPAALPGGGGMLAGPGAGNVVPLKPPVKAGLLATPNKIITPFGEAHQAPDGNHYVKHPATGKYLRVKRVAGR